MNQGDWDKVADNYYEEIYSPLVKGVRNPLKHVIKSLPETEKNIVLDAGCGTGELIPFLSREFKQVVAIDFSPKMIEAAIAKKSHNTDIRVHDILETSRLGIKFDVVVAVNSILMPSIEAVNRAFSELSSSLKKGGYFIGIFPSVEANNHLAMVLYNQKKRCGNGCDESKIIADVKKNICGVTNYDFLFGFFKEDGIQKNYYLSELNYYLTRAGLKVLKMYKVLYPWSESPHPELKGIREPSMWDWLVFCRKE